MEANSTCTAKESPITESDGAPCEPNVASSDVSSTDAAASSSNSDVSESNRAPTCIIVLGMAGSGKTTFVQRLIADLHMRKQPPYVVNLDPACANIPYPCNVDIRDTVKYSEVMRTYELGPNGAIMTSLNLFATRFGSVVSLIEKQRGRSRYCVIDTPGQIEVFSWSASGTIIAESLAAGFPTMIAYVVDTVRCAAPHTFVSNMLYACSTFFKFRLPLVVVLNKCDARAADQLIKWLTDWETLDAAVGNESAYVSNLTRSLSLVLDDFYSDMRYVGVSALTGQGIDEFLVKVGDAEKEYFEEVLPDMEARRKQAAAKRAKRVAKRSDAASNAAAGGPVDDSDAEDVSWCWWRSHTASEDDDDDDDDDDDEEHELPVGRADRVDDEELGFPARLAATSAMDLDDARAGPSTRPAKAKAASGTQKKVTFAE